MAFLFYILAWLSILGGAAYAGYLVVNATRATAGTDQWIAFALNQGLPFTMPALQVILAGLVLLAIAGILYRNKDPEIHKRLMFMATVVVAARFPFIGRLFGTGWHHYVDQDAFLLVGVLYDLITRGRVNKAYIWGGLIFVLMPPAADLSFRYLVPHLMAVQPSLP